MVEQKEEQRTRKLIEVLTDLNITKYQCDPMNYTAQLKQQTLTQTLEKGYGQPVKLPFNCKTMYL